MKELKSVSIEASPMGASRFESLWYGIKCQSFCEAFTSLAFTDSDVFTHMLPLSLHVPYISVCHKILLCTLSEIVSPFAFDSKLLETVKFQI